MRVPSIVAVCVWSCAIGFAWGQGGKSPLELVPSDCALVVKLSSPDATFTRMEETIDEAAAGMGALVSPLRLMVGEMLGNADLTGIDPAGHVWMAMRFRAGEDPERVFLVPSKSPKEVQEAVGELYTFHVDGKWVIYSESEELIELFKKLKSGTGRPLNKFVDANCNEILEKSDLAVWCDIPSLRRAYGEQIDEWKSQAEQMIQELPEKMPPQQGVDPEQIAKMYEGMLSGSLKGLEDSRAFCGSVSVIRGGILLDNYLSFSFTSETAKWLKTLETSDFKTFSKLPQSHVIYYGVSGLSDTFMKWAMNFSTTALTDEKAKQAFQEAAKEIAEAGIGTMVGSVDIGAPDEGAMQMVSLVNTSDSSKWKSVLQKTMGAMPELVQNGLKIRYEFKPEEEEFGGHKADVLSMIYEVEDPASPQGMIQQQVLSAMYGPEGMKTRTFYLEEQVLYVAGSNFMAEDAMNAYLGRPKAVRKSAANEEGEKKEAVGGGGFGDSEEKNAGKETTKKQETKEGEESAPVRPLFKKRSKDERRGMFMLEDEPVVLAAQLGRKNGKDDEGKGGGLKFKVPPQGGTPPAKETPKSETAPAAPTAEEGTAATPEEKPAVEETPGTEVPAGSPASEFPPAGFSGFPADTGPQELPPRDVTEAMKQARARLSPKSNVIVFVDLPAMLAKTMRRIPFLASFGVPVSKFVAAAETPSFTGVSLAADGNAMRFRVSVTPEQMKGIGQIVTTVSPLLERMQSGQPLTGPPPAKSAPAGAGAEESPSATPETVNDPSEVSVGGTAKPPVAAPKARPVPVNQEGGDKDRASERGKD